VEDLEVVGPGKQFWRGKRVLVTGVTGFKGSWLALGLNQLGSQVHGISLPPDQRPNLYSLAKVGEISKTRMIDVRQARPLSEVVGQIKPQIIFHLAAQPIVRAGYFRAKQTWDTNLTGTIHLLESARKLASLKVLVVVTTDKVYENLENGRRCRETDRLGGCDPYSSSKAMAEQVVASYRQSFFQKGPVRLVTARAGNVIGGGDWAEDRIVPDAIRALGKRKPIPVRNPNSVRPWQHVLDPLSGYLTLAAALRDPASRIREPGCRRNRNPQSRILNPGLSGAYNFGPNHDANRTVRELVEELLKKWPGKWRIWKTRGAPHEAGLLQLDNSLARRDLDWRPKWGFRQAIHRTVEWYRRVERDGLSARELTLRQIAEYCLHES